MRIPILLSGLLGLSSVLAVPPKGRVCSFPSNILRQISSETSFDVHSASGRTLAFGIGHNIWSCSEEGIFTQSSSIAELFDLSCLTQGRDLSRLGRLMATFRASIAQQDAIQHTSLMPETADHMFRRVAKIPLATKLGTAHLPPGSSNKSIFTFTSSDIQQTFLVAKEHETTPSPHGPHLPWAVLRSASGTKVVRWQTSGGRPAKRTCSQGERLSKPYAAMYAFLDETQESLYED